jgi:hypothetical protein
LSRLCAKPNGVFTVFDAPGAGTGYQQGTLPNSINDAGAITGYYLDADASSHGFVRGPSGPVETSDAPPASGTSGTYAYNINNAGAIAGFLLKVRCITVSCEAPVAPL